VESKLVPAEAGGNTEAWLVGVVLLAWRLKAAFPDAKHPGKAWGNPKGKVNFPPWDFPGFLGPEAHILSVAPAPLADVVE